MIKELYEDRAMQVEGITEDEGTIDVASPLAGLVVTRVTDAEEIGIVEPMTDVDVEPSFVVVRVVRVTVVEDATRVLLV